MTENGYKGFLIDSPLSVELTGKEQILNLSDEYEGLEGLASVTFAEFKGYGTFHVHVSTLSLHSPLFSTNWMGSSSW